MAVHIKSNGPGHPSIGGIRTADKEGSQLGCADGRPREHESSHRGTCLGGDGSPGGKRTGDAEKTRPGRKQRVGKQRRGVLHRYGEGRRAAGDHRYGACGCREGTCG